MAKDVIRIGNAGGYWGDDPSALQRQVQGGPLDYISMDFLAEITMSIMQKQRSRNPDLGYARDFITMLRGVFPQLLENKTKIITNAGGVNPKACAMVIKDLAKELGLNPKIAIVHGDDILDKINDLKAAGAKFENMETGENFAGVADRLQAANIYFGAQPVVKALAHDPDIIITGRVTDTGITMAPMIHEYGWAFDDWDKLAAGIVAGHLLECGSQATGGNFTDWQLVPFFNNMGYPIVEMKADASFVLTKHPGTGGLVSVDTVREQLFYEMGNPKAYITPDVVADFSSIELSEAGENRVGVQNVKGCEPTPFYKVSMAYGDGYKAVGSILISGPNARQKAEAFADIFWQRFEAGKFIETETEFFGWNACHRSLGHQEDGNEIILRLGARADSDKDLRAFGKMIPSLILAGPPGVAVTGGVPKAQEVVSYWPALIDKKLVHPSVAILEENGFSKDEHVSSAMQGDFLPPNDGATQTAESPSQAVDKLLEEQSANPDWKPLSTICLGRSGDKGDMCNVGVMARSQEAFEFLEEYLSAQKVKDLFQELCKGPVVRYRLENMKGFNFLLETALGGGGTKTMRSDAQGKTFAQALLRQRAPIPDSLINSNQ